MIEWNLQEANPIRLKLIKAAIKKLTQEIQDIDDSLLVNAKNPQIFTKIKLELPSTCEACEGPYDGFTIVDLYDLSKDENLLSQDTRIVCKKCSKKVKAKL